MDATVGGEAGRRQRRRLMRIACELAAIGLLVFLFRSFLFQGNFGVVEPGRVYRSAQPKGELEQTIREHELASILNLRGGGPDDWWYQNEARVAAAHGVDFYDLPLRATRRPTRRELLTLLDVFENCRYPILIHCKSGADRTGLAVALYQLLCKGVPPDRAKKAFSVWYGHVPMLGPERLHEPLDEYAKWLKARSLPHTAARFRHWVEREYRTGGSEDPAFHGPPRPGTRISLRSHRPRPAR